MITQANEYLILFLSLKISLAHTNKENYKNINGRDTAISYVLINSQRRDPLDRVWLNNQQSCQVVVQVKEQTDGAK